MKQVKLLWLLIPLFLLFHGCEKDYTQEQGEETQIVLTEVQQNFLDKSYVSRNNPNLIKNLNPRNNPNSDMLIDAFQSIPNFETIIDNISRRYGYPMWDETVQLYSTLDNDGFLIPITKTELNYITAFFAVMPKNNGKYSFYLEKRDKIEKEIDKPHSNYKNLHAVVGFINEFDSKLFAAVSNVFKDWYNNYSNITEYSLTNRACYIVRIYKCVKIFAARNEEISTRNCPPGEEYHVYDQTVCDGDGVNGGNDCQTCTGDGDSGGGANGDSSYPITYDDDSETSDPGYDNSDPGTADPEYYDPDGDGSGTDSYYSANFVFISETWFNSLKANGESFDDILSLDDLLSSTAFFPQQSDYTRMLQYIENIKDMCNNRCLDYGEHGDYIDNWLASVNSSNNVTTGEVYEMALWCKALREEILARHLLQFGSDLQTILDIAAWEFDLFATQRFFSSVPSSSRTWGINRMISKLSSPISSFSKLKHAQKFGIQSYDDLGKVFKELNWTRSGKGVEFHHLIEQRFVNNSEVVSWMGSSSTGKWPSIVADKLLEHQYLFTNKWRELIGYGTTKGSLNVTTTTATIADIKKAAKIVYKEFPEILQYLGLN